MRRTSLLFMALLLLNSPGYAREIVGEGTVSGTGVTLNAGTPSASDVNMRVTSTGSGGFRSSGAFATGVQAAGQTAFSAERVTAQAVSGANNLSMPGSVTADSTSTALGVSVSGRTARLFTATDLTVSAASGDVTAESTDGFMARAGADSTGLGVRSSAVGAVRLEGTSAVTVRAGTATARGRATATATSIAAGVEIAGGDIRHTGTLDVRSLAGQADAAGGYAESNAHATGLHTNTGQVIQSGTVNVYAEGGQATGDSGQAFARAMGVQGDTVINAGTVNVKAKGGQKNDGAALGAGVGLSGADVRNSGNVTVNAQGRQATAMGILGETGVVNTGSVTVGAEGEGSSAIGLSVSGDVVNRGDINVTSGETAMGIAFFGPGSLMSLNPVVVPGGFETVVQNAGDAVRVSAYSLGLGSATGRTFGGPGEIVLENAQLRLRPVPGFTANRFYQVQDADGLATELGTATVSGTVGGVTSAHPDLQAEVRGQTGNQSVALTYEPPSSQPGESMHVQQATVMYAGTVLRDHLAESLLWPVPAGLRTQVFVRPYGGELRFTGSPAGYKGHVGGVIAGVEYAVDSWLLGLHMGMDQSRIHFAGAYDGRREDSTSVFAGIHAGRHFENGLVVNATTTVFRAEHDARYSAEESARALSLAWYNTLGLGWAWRITETQTLVPEVSVVHMWQFRNNYNTEVKPGFVNTRYEEGRNQEAFATAGLTWTGLFPVTETWKLRLHTGGGVRRTLTDGDIRVDQFMEGVSVHSALVQGDRTAGYVNAGFGMEGETFSWDVAWLGSFAGHSRGNGVQGVLRWRF